MLPIIANKRHHSPAAAALAGAVFERDGPSLGRPPPDLPGGDTRPTRAVKSLTAILSMFWEYDATLRAAHLGDLKSKLDGGQDRGSPVDAGRGWVLEREGIKKTGP